MTVTDRSDAPAPSPAEQAVIDRSGIFAEERVIEEVARAIFAADAFPGPAWEDDAEGNREDYRRLAAAAVSAYRPAQDGEAEETVRRLLGLIAHDLRLHAAEWPLSEQFARRLDAVSRLATQAQQ